MEPPPQTPPQAAFQITVHPETQATATAVARQAMTSPVFDFFVSVLMN